MTSSGRTPARLVVLGAVMLATAGLAVQAARPELPPLRAPLDLMPATIGLWQGYPAPAFAPEVLAQLGVDDYLNRVYIANGQPVALYIGYYRSQREGDTIHSPQNCLPGAGWLPVATSYLAIPVDGRPAPVTVNSLLIQKGLDRQVVLYWYQSHGRVVASDFESKAYLVYDAVRLRRSDAAMVRIVSPVLPSESDETAATERAVAFVEAAFPKIDHLLPI